MCNALHTVLRIPEPGTLLAYAYGRQLGKFLRLRQLALVDLQLLFAIDELEHHNRIS